MKARWLCSIIVGNSHFGDRKIMTARYDSPSAAEHREKSPQQISCAVITVSDTRTLADDKSGAEIVRQLESAGHNITERKILKDELIEIRQLVEQLSQNDDIEVILITGGTGIAPRDQTPEAVKPLFTKELPGYGELLRMLSYEEIGAAAMLSRAVGGIVDKTVVLTTPGSTAAVRLAMEKLVLPEIGHLVNTAKG